MARRLIVLNYMRISDFHKLKKALKNNEIQPKDLHIMEVVPHFPVFFYQYIHITQVELVVYKDVERKMNLIADRLGIPKNNRWISMGPVNREIERVAKRLQIDVLEPCERIEHSLHKQRLSHKLYQIYHFFAEQWPKKALIK